MLSGFVLSVKFIESPGRYSALQVTISRYFRLVIPIFLTNIIFYIMMKEHLFYNVHAAAAAHSEWIGRFFRIMPTPAGLLKDTFYSTFFDVDYYTTYNALNMPLWTMPTELGGSVLVFLFAAVFLNWPTGRKYRLQSACAMVLGFFYAYPRIACFFLGYLLAELYQVKKLQTRMMSLLATIAFAVPIISSTISIFIDDHYLTLVAVATVFAVAFSPPLKVVFSCSPPRYLGRIAYPLYLINLAVVCSYASYLCVRIPFPGFDIPASCHLILLSSIVLSLGFAAMLSPMERYGTIAAHCIAARIVNIGTRFIRTPKKNDVTQTIAL